MFTYLPLALPVVLALAFLVLVLAPGFGLSMKDRRDGIRFSRRWASELGGVATAVQEKPTESSRPQLLVPFTQAAREVEEPIFDRTTAALSASSQQIGPIAVPARGFLRHLYILVESSAGGGAAAVAKEDAPFSIIEQISLTDTNGANVIVPITGYDLMLINKFGGYEFSPDPRAMPPFSAVAATGAFAFALRVPVEVNRRHALGALANQNGQQQFQLNLAIADRGKVYSTDPTTIPTVRVRIWAESWTQPPATDAAGRTTQQRPEHDGTYQFWKKVIVNVVAGEQTVKLPHVGNLIRNIILCYRTTTPARSTTNFPDRSTLEYDTHVLHNRSKLYWQQLMAERYGFATASLETGVFVHEFTHDFDGHPGGEMGDQYLPTTEASRVEFKGTFGADGTLTILTNELAPAVPSVPA